MRVTNKLVNRRRILQGMLGGSAFTVGLPLLDCFWDGNGSALAATGVAPSPVFLSWAYGLGLNPGFWQPNEIGKFKSFGLETEALTPFREKINVFSGFDAKLGSANNVVHQSGPVAVLNGNPLVLGTANQPSLDTLIADTISTKTRFKSLELCSDGVSRSRSNRANGVINPSEGSPTALYQRLFGADFVDPNAAEFKPDPKIALRKSALSAVTEQRKELLSQVGASDRHRLDEYFTSLRELEKEMEILLEKPAPLESCAIPEAPMEIPSSGSDVDLLLTRNRLFSKLLAHAFACGQTNVANMVLNQFVYFTRQGNPQTHHLYTHEEGQDEKLGYQPNVHKFAKNSVKAMADTLAALDNIKEGDGTLLDRALVFINTDVGYATNHSVENIPLFTVGSAGGRFKTGLHISESGESVSRVGYTIMRALGVPISQWGTDLMTTSKVVSEVLA